MNYITINGVRSDTVRGLLIQSLPPITKPKMRTSIEEIDGRDGDVITKLGYSAYDKEVSIGLYGDFDIDDCIKFFDSEGNVVFSNEQDKYYRYTIIDQIDFERLIRFRTATVKFHVQPFKFSDVDKSISWSSNLIAVKDYESNSHSVDLKSHTTIAINGTATKDTEFYIPINKLTLKSGTYNFSVFCGGTASGSSIRLISGRPSNNYSFGGRYLSLSNNKSVSFEANDTGSMTYDYLWLYIPQGTAINVTLSISLKNDNHEESVIVYNRGNTFSRPRITIIGGQEAIGTKIELSINDTKKLTIDMSDTAIIIDTSEQNAYYNGILLNRHVAGDYSEVTLNTGANEVSWNGIVEKIIIEDFSRWI